MTTHPCGCKTNAGVGPLARLCAAYRMSGPEC
jgi:hypothetical protein